MAVNAPSRTVRLLALLFFGARERIRVWKKLQTQLRNRMRLEESLRQLQRHARESKSPLEDIYGHVLATLGEGRTLDVALEGLATPEEVMLISSAQASGRLAEGLGLAVRALEAKSAMRKCLVANLTAPVLMFLACMAMMVIIALHVMPQLALVSDPSRWTGPSRVLHVLSTFIGSWAGAAFGVGLLLALIAEIGRAHV